MISFEEYKTLCRKYNLDPCIRGGLIKAEEAKAYTLPFYSDEDYLNGVGGLIVTNYSKLGARVTFDFDDKSYKSFPWLVTTEQFEMALIELTKEVKDYRLKRKLENIKKDF